MYILSNVEPTQTSSERFGASLLRQKCRDQPELQDDDVWSSLQAVHTRGGGHIYDPVGYHNGAGIIFVTASGYLGLSSHVKIDDIVTVIFGCSYPVVLRAAGESSDSKNSDFRLVCDAIVPAINRGELVDLYEDGEASEQTFRII